MGKFDIIIFIVNKLDGVFNLIIVDGIRKKYKKYVLEDISFSVEKGQCIGILGANGCGKSTLLSIMAGTQKSNGGKIFYNGIDTCTNKNVFTDYIGYVPQENPLIEELTVNDNLKLWYSNSKKDLKKDYLDGVPAMLGLDQVKKTVVGKLSGGMKRRVSIAAALANDAPILILDELSAALDLVCKNEIRQYLMHYLKENGTIVMTTHEEDEIGLCNRILVMKGGKLSETDPNLSIGALVDKL